MRIQHNIMSMNAYRNYNNNSSALSKNLEKLSSGYKINRAGDDAAGLAISEKMRAQITGLNVAQDNAQDGISLVQTAEGALTQVHDMLNRMYELASKAENGTLNDTNRGEVDKEIQELKKEINRIAETTKFNGITLLNGDGTGAAGSATSVNLKIGAGAGAANTLTVSVSAASATALGVNSIDATSATNATAALTAIETAIDTVSGIRGTLGANQNRLEHTINNLSVTEENLTNAESTIRDTDVADEMMKYTKNNILVQSAQAMLAQANQVPQGVLQLLQ